jgi:hypothetical protein
VADKLRELSGNISAVARAFRTTRQSVYSFIGRRPDLKAVVAESRETMKDNVESALYTAALRGDAWAVCFFLKCQAKDRGYVEHEKPRPRSRAELEADLDLLVG